MSLLRKIRVLIVDDSLFVREALARGLSDDPNIEVVATASDPFMARDKILEFEPDVMTLDVEMPKMNGIEFLKRLMPQYPLPVVVVSSSHNNIFESLNAGAVDFVTKPSTTDSRGLQSLVNELAVKVKIASTAKVGHWKNAASTIGNLGSVSGNLDNKIIAIGASTGGTEAIASIVKSLPRLMPGIVIVQHMPAVFTQMYAERLNNSCLLEVKEAKHGDKIQPGRILIAPGEFHMRVKKIGDEFQVDCIKGEKVSGHCPSVDVLFQSVAQNVGKNAIGVILTGMGQDGAKGLLAMRQKSAHTIGQDESTSVVYGMPKVAFDIGAVEKQAALEDIPGVLFSIINGQI